MAERKGSCNSEAGEFTRKSEAPALRRKGSRRRRHDATHRAESLLLSTEKQNGQAKMLVRFAWRRERDSNPCASFLTTAFRVRLVMTSSISLQSDYVGEMPNVCNIQHFAGFGNHIAVILQKSFNSDSRKK